VICEFSVVPTYGNDAYATGFVDALVNYAVSDFTPGYEIPNTSQ
jgi:hypothetical protein